MLVDAGFDWSPGLKALKRALKGAGVRRNELNHIVVTHAHVDHLGGAGEVRDRWGGTVYLHPEEAQLNHLPSTDELLPWYRREGLPDRLVEDYREEFGEGGAHFEVPAETEPMTEERQLQVGAFQFEVIVCPGHSPAQTVLFEPNHGWLFAGDEILTANSFNVYDNSNQANHDPLGQYLEGLQQFSSLEDVEDVRYLLPAHGMPEPGDKLSDRVHKIEDYQIERADRVRRQLHDQPATAYEITCRLAPEAGPPEYDLEVIRRTMNEVLICLRYLERRSSVSSSEENGTRVWYTSSA